MISLKCGFVLKIFAVIWLIPNSLFTDGVFIKFTNYKCEKVDTSIVQVHQCRLKAVKRDVVTLNFNATLLETAHKLRAEAALFKRANGYKPWLYKLDIDVCRFLKRAYNPIALALMGEVLRYSSFNHSCPYNKGPLAVQGWYLKPEAYLRLPFPFGDYLVVVKWIVNQKLAGTGEYYFTVSGDL